MNGVVSCFEEKVMSLLLHPSSIFNIHHAPVSTILSAYIRSNTLMVAVVNEGEGKGE